MSAVPTPRRGDSPLARRLKRIALMVGIPVVLGLVALLVLWNTFFKKVDPGQMLVVISKTGTEPADGGLVATKPGEKGIRAEVLGEGWHFIMPVVYTTEVKPNFVVPGGRFSGVARPTPTGRGKQAPAVPSEGRPKVGIVTARVGDPLPAGQFLADEGQRGIRRAVLLPGTYRLNPYAYDVKLVDMVEVRPGFVGVKRRILGTDGPDEFATGPNMKGIIREEILQPGFYPINTEEYEVISCDVGIYQTTYHYTNTGDSTALEFDASDGNRIKLDCTIEWELKPEFWPEKLSKFRQLERVESTVIKPNVKNISRNKGQNYGAEDFLDGFKREKFQDDFRKELAEVCKADNVIVRSAYIRNIIINESFLEPKRKEQLDREKTITQKELTETAESANLVAEAKQTVQLEIAKVKSKTEKLVAGIEQQTENLKVTTEAEIEKMKDENAAEVAILEAQRKEMLGKAEADSKKLVNTAKSNLYKLKMGVFNRDADAFLRYTMAQELSDNMKLRLFQSGPGTLWTNMGNKDMNFMMPLPAHPTATPEKKAETPPVNGTKGPPEKK